MGFGRGIAMGRWCASSHRPGRGEGAGSVSASGNQVAGLPALQAALLSWRWPNYSFKRKPLRGSA